ncbi:MAG TPA: (p)ppGpp synthetase [Firmicutes bacterium]|nr:(p)ppGpp synthetase [Bacillota bacterium]
MTNEQYYELIIPYRDALNLLMARLDVLNHSIYSTDMPKPIHNTQSRIKTKQSIEGKLQRKGMNGSVVCAKENLRDIAGIRVICYFVQDVELLADNLKGQGDLITIQERDYITNPKPNGYRSYHLILGIPVYYMERTEYYPVEVQIRTIAMDFWASMEHRICYKQERKDKEEIQATLKQYAQVLNGMEEGFRSLNEEEKGRSK